MRRVRTGTGIDFETTDAVADALIEYAWALADHRRRDVVRIPVRQVDGSVASVALLLGPPLQLATEPILAEEDEIDPALAGELAGRTAELRTVLLDGFFDAWTAPAA